MPSELFSEESVGPRFAYPINRRQVLVGLALLFVQSRSAAQGKTRIWRIGFLSGVSRPPSLENSPQGGLLRGMSELGYIEGKDFVVEWRFADGKYERFPELAAELVSMKVDVIVAGTPPAIPVLKKATSTIPIVMGIALDPVASGFVASLSRPGGNITGLAATSDINVKHLDLLKLLLPKLSRVALLVNPENAGHGAVVKMVQTAGSAARVDIVSVGASTPTDLPSAFASMNRQSVDAFILVTDGFFLTQRRPIAELAVKHRLPWIVGYREYMELGGLMSYGQPLSEFYRRTAAYVDRILKGARAGELPVEQPTEYEMVINLKTAKTLGLTIPQSLLLRADQVIE